MISAGKKDTFAIAAEVTSEIDGWILGRIRFIFHDKVCGNWDDEVDLRACYSWLSDFVQNPRNRDEPGLNDLSKDQVFERLVLPVIYEESSFDRDEVYPDTFSRFHISHLCMSSFDNVVMFF